MLPSYPGIAPAISRMVTNPQHRCSKGLWKIILQKNKRSGFGADLEGHSGNFSDEPLLSLTLAAQRFIHSPGTTSNELKVRTLDLTPPNMRQVDFEGVVPILFFFFGSHFGYLKDP